MKQKIELTTARLLVRTPDEQDVQDVFSLMSDTEIAQNTGFRPMDTPSEAEGKIRRGMNNLDLFVIAEKSEPAHAIGVFEVAPHKVTTTSGEKCDFEICYFLHRNARKKGYMTEVVDTMKAYLFNTRKADSLTIAVLPRNDASRRVALKNGFHYKGLDRQCGLTYHDELVDLEYYTLDKEGFLNPGATTDSEEVRIVERQKWVNEGGVLYPIPGYATLLPSPGNGIFRIYEEPRTKRLGLEKIDDTFTFKFKIYDLDCEDIMARVIRTWTSELFAASNKNLGVIFNGLKGTGKTIAAKLLCNRIGLPVIVISKPLEGMLEFIQSLCFESIILIDEAEKTFNEDRDVLLKMIDGVYNNQRKLYILTTNKLTVDENLLGRPGRIRYIKEFTNLSGKAINEIIEDNLTDMSLKNGILKLIDTLEISTIDILKAIIDECNIMGEVPSTPMMNIPKAKFKVRIICFEELDIHFHREVEEHIKARLSPGETVEDWLMGTTGQADEGKIRRNKDAIEEEYDCKVNIQSHPSISPYLFPDQRIRYGTVTNGPDKWGFFTLESDWDETSLCCIGNKTELPSPYKGKFF